jgi:hypothetical protein
MRRVIDVLLVVLVLAVVGLGAYYIGHRVDNESNSLSKSDSELNGTTVAAGTHVKKSHETPIIIGAALGGAALLMVLGSATSAAMRSRKRERWHA